ncbi:FBXL4-like protein [Mya arenaria]|uniref:FBXL4-like protein n=1 Tax=Mya arenaria TaxID=6604 RepID=A0ABY7EAC4_MYAAR|nr:FBXL4-like protein [Mya arenaria]
MENVHTTRCGLFLLFVLQDTFAIEVVNISINKTAIQTDTSGNGTADLAVDGVISGGTCAQTSSALASWEVDLGDFYVIDNVLVHPKPDEAPPAAQWVQSVGGFSSEYSSAGWSAQKIVGPPNVYPLYGDIVESWSPYYKDSNQFIELEFATSVYVGQVDIYETFHAGGVKAIKCYQAGQWVTLWSTALVEDLSIARIFSPPLQVTDCFTNMIRLELDLTVANTFVEIDAVQIHGVSQTSIAHMEQY